MIKLNAFITDDEAVNRETLSLMLTEYCPSVQIAGMASNIRNTLRGLEEHEVDILFLDIDLGGGETGFDLLDIKADSSVSVVFITAHEHYAVKAFQYGAIHYLLKPLNRKDLIETITRVKNHRNASIKEWQKQFFHAASARVALGDMNCTELVKPEDIIYLEAKGSYTSFTLKNKRVIMQSKGLRVFEEMLQEYPQFIKVHRSFVVNKEHIIMYTKESSTVALTDGYEIPVAGAFKDLKALM